MAVLCAALAALAPGSPLATAPAWAQDGADATYKQHMQNGVKLYQEQNWSGALAEFEAAYRAKPRASPLLNIALCQKAQFHYPKAIVTLERALVEHGDTMDEADTHAAREAVTELRALLGTVRLVLEPKTASVRVDGEALAPGASGQPIPLGPGGHVISASAPGYEAGERSVTISSGEKDKKVELRLVANQGYLTVVAKSPQNAIAVDQEYVGKGRWSGLLDPGPHTVQIYLPGAKSSGVGQQVVIGAGQLREVKEGDATMTPLVTGPPPAYLRAPKPDAPPPDLHGRYATLQGGVFGLLGKLGGDAGPTIGARLGWRPITPLGLEALLQLDHVDGASSGPGVTGAAADLRMIRIGGNLRAMSRGRVVRYVAALGGGMSIDHLDYDDRYCPGDRCDGSDNTGANWFVNLENAVEVDIRGMFAGLVLQHMFTSAGDLDGPDVGDFHVFVGFALRVGYGTW
jgi:hypothetical protein